MLQHTNNPLFHTDPTRVRGYEIDLAQQASLPSMIRMMHEAAMQHVLHVNTIVPALWLKALAPALKRASASVVAVTSARVGSIGDNRMGGWYSYRASKAALNMVLKSAAIEYRRRAPRVKVMAFHPGTTDSDLSRPFQRGVPDGVVSGIDTRYVGAGRRPLYPPHCGYVREECALGHGQSSGRRRGSF